MVSSKIFLGLKNILGVKLGSQDGKLCLGEIQVYPLGKTIANAIVTCDSAIYNGSVQIAQNIVVTLSGETLVEGIDYTIRSNTGGTNAGSYSVVVGGEGEYVGVTSGTFVINKVTPTVTAPTAITGITYNGSAHALVNAGSTNYGTLKYSLDGSTYSASIPSGTNATSYTVYYKVEGDSNINEVPAQTVSVTIAKADGRVITAPTAISGLIYNGNSQTIINSGSGTGTMMYKLDSGSWGTSIPTATNATTYTVYYKASASTNYNESASGSVSCSIAKVTPTVTAPTPITGITYDGVSHVLANAGSTNYGTLVYCLNNSGGTYSTSIPSSTNANSYDVWYKVSGDSNVNSTTALKIECTIAKANPSYTAPTTRSVLTYNASAQALLNGGSTSDGTMQYSSDNSSWSTTIPTGTNVGTYTSYWRIVGDANHNDKGSASISTEISANTVNNPTITLSPSEYTYNGNPCQPTPTVKVGSLTISSSEYTVSYSNNVSAGTATCTITDVSGGNYIVNGSKTFTINKVTPTVTAPTPKTLTYNTQSQVLANSGSTDYGTMVYCLNNSGGTYSTIVPSAINANTTYYVWYKVSGDSNVNSTSPESVECMIAEKRVTTPTITPSHSSYTYDGSAHTPSVTVKDGSTVIPSSEYTVSYSNNVNAGNGTIVISDNTLGNYYISGTTTFTINKASCYINTPPTAKSLTYNGSAQALVNGGSGGSGTILYKLGSSGTYGTSIPTSTNAGSYTVYYKASASTNYNEGCESSVSCSIAKKAISCTAPTAKSLAYNGSAQALVNAGSVVGGSMTYSTASTGTYSSSIPSGTSAGSYTVYWKGAPDSSGNYSGSCSGSVDVTIAKASCSVTTAPTAKTGLVYTSSAQALVNAGASNCTMQYKLGSDSWSTSIPSATTAGSYTVYYKATSNNSDYSDSASGSVSCSIAKASCSVTVSGINGTYNGSAQNLLTVSNNCESGTMHYRVGTSGSWTTTIPTATDVGTWTIYWYRDATTNYNGNYSSSSPGSVTAKINCLAPTISANPAAKTGLVYNGSSQTLLSGGTANVSGTWSYGSGTNANTYSNVSWTFTPSSSNYCTKSGTVSSVTIAPKAISCTAPTAKSLTYSASAQALVNAGSVAGGSMTYSTASTGTYSSSIPSGTSAGSYTVYWKGAPSSGNYSGSCSGSVSCSIAKADQAAPTATGATTTYPTGATATASGGGGQGTLTWTNGSSRSSCGSQTTKAYWAGNSNYNASPYSNEVTIKVNTGATPSYTAPTAKSGLVYNGSSQTLYNVGSSSNGTFSYSNGTRTSAGSQTVSWTFTPTDSCYYGTSGSFIASIAQKAVVCTAPTAKSLTWNGSAQTLANAGSCEGGTIQYCSTSGGTYSGTIPTGTNAGSYTVWYKCTASNNNYSGTCSGSTSCSIAKAAMSYTAPKAATRTYNGSAQQIVSGQSANGGSIYYATSSAGASSSTTVPTQTNTGTSYSTYWKAVPDSNHSGGTSSWEQISNCKITQKALTITAKAQTITWGGSITQGTGQTTTSGLVDGDALTAITLTPSTTAVTTTGTITPSAGATTKGIGNYSVTYSTGTLTINKKTGCAISFATTAVTKTYGNAAFTNAATNNGDSTITWSSSNTGVCTINSSGQVTIVKAGSCTITAKVANTSNCTYSTTAATYNITVNKAAGSISYSTRALTKTYGDAAFTNTLTKTGDGSVTYSSSNTGICTVNSSGQVTIKQASGTSCTITATVTDGTNYTYATKTATYTVTVNKANGSVTINGVSLTYNGSARNLATVSSNTGAMHYKLDNGSWVTTIPTATNATSYTVYWYMDASTNYNGIASASTRYVSSTIAKKTGCAISFATTAVTKTYGNAAFTNAITNTGDGSLTWGSSNTNIATVNSSGQVTIKAAGSCTISATTTSTTNCTYSTTAASYSLSIAKASQAAPTATGATVTYHNTATATASGGGGQGSIEWSNGSTRTATGTTTTAARWSGNSNYNASPYSAQVNLVVNKATDQSITVTLTNRTYNGGGQVVATATSHGITNYYLGFGSSSTSAPTSWGSANSSISQTNAGTYYVWYKGTADSNHSADISATYKGTVTIGCASQSAPTATGATVTYPSTATATASGGGGVGTLTWTNGSSRSAIGSTSTQAYWSGNGNYCASSKSSAVTLQVNKYTPTVTLSATNRAYNGSALYATASVTTPSGGVAMKGTIYYGTSAGATTYSVTYTGGSVNLSSVSVTNVGSATVYAYFAPDSSCNSYYNNSGNASKTFSVSKADQSAPTAAGAITTYPTTATATASGGGGQGSIQWSNGNTQTSVGSKTTKARWSGNGNYNASPYSNEVTVKMNKQTPLVFVNDIDKTYNGQPQYTTANVMYTYGGVTPKGTIYYGTSAGATTYSVTYTGGTVNLSSVSITNSGSIMVYAYFVPDSSCNSYYNNSGNANGMINIFMANQSAPTATGATTTYPTTATATASGGGGQGSIQWSNGNTQTSVGSKTTKARWSGNGNYNASPYSNEVTVQMNKYTPTVALSVTNRAYNGSALYATASVATPSGGVAMKGTIYYGTSAGATTYSVTYNGATTYSVNLGSVSVTNVGSATVYAYFAPDSSCNSYYNNSGNASKTFSVSKANQSAPTATGATVTYHNTATATASGGGGQGTLTWTNGSTRTATGSQDTYAYWAGNSNYNASPNSNKVTLTVNKATDQSITVTLNNIKYNGASLCVASATKHGMKNFQLGFGSSSTSAPTSWTTDNYLYATNVGTYYIWYKGTVDENHSADISATYKGTATISCSGTTISTKPTAKTLTYNGSAQALVNAGTAPSNTTMYYNLNGGTWGTSIPSGTNAGTYTVGYQARGNNSNYCNSASGTVSVTIAKRAITSCTPTAKSVVYNGSAQVIVNDCTPTGGDIQYSGASNSSYSTTVPTRTDVGTYTINWKNVPDSNHSGGTTGQITTAKITCKACTVTTAPTIKSGLKYTGSAQALITAGACSAGGTMVYKLGSGSWSTSIPSGTNSSYYSVYWMASANTSNYCNSAQGGEMDNARILCSGTTISSPPTVKTGLWATGGNITLINAGTAPSNTYLEYSGASNSSWSTTLPYASAAGTYTIKYRAHPNSSNYCYSSEGTLTVTLSDPYAGHAYVNLGLPSGTKWATMNIGASSATAGGYFYQYGKGTKQYAATVGQSAYSGTENPLSLSVDSARCVWGGLWATPTLAQWQELTGNTTITFGNDGGVYIQFTASNGNYIRMPASGWQPQTGGDPNNPRDKGSVGDYWLATPSGSYAYYFEIMNGLQTTQYGDRLYGMTIRPVIKF